MLLPTVSGRHQVAGIDGVDPGDHVLHGHRTAQVDIDGGAVAADDREGQAAIYGDSLAVIEFRQ
jgi:hypothetical protein